MNRTEIIQASATATVYELLLPAIIQEVNAGICQQCKPDENRDQKVGWMMYRGENFWRATDTTRVVKRHFI
jgi:hypothetical protein